MVEIKRTTKETDIFLKLDINGTGVAKISTSIGFFDHMLESFAKHSYFDLQIECKGDVNVDFHHSVEDVGIVLGEAITREIYPISGVERFGEASIVMDEARVKCSLDLSNRPFLFFGVEEEGKIGEFDAELVEEFFRAVVLNSRISAHIEKERGRNKHHVIEAAFKSFAVALRRALAKNQRAGVPSTKGVL